MYSKGEVCTKSGRFYQSGSLGYSTMKVKVKAYITCILFEVQYCHRAA